MYRLDLFYDGVLVEEVTLEDCSMLKAVRHARSLLDPKRVNVVNIYKEGQWIKKYMC